MSATSHRNCYCSPSPAEPTADAQLPLGFCALCDACGKPGHLRHFPGTAPFTGGYCDRHYALTRWLHPFGQMGFFIWLGAGLLVAILLQTL